MILCGTNYCKVETVENVLNEIKVNQVKFAEKVELLYQIITEQKVLVEKFSALKDRLEFDTEEHKEIKNRLKILESTFVSKEELLDSKDESKSKFSKIEGYVYDILKLIIAFIIGMKFTGK